MSIQWIVWTWQQSPLRETKLLIHLALADIAHPDGRFFASQTKIAEMSRCTTKYVSHVVREMEELGLLRIVEKGNGRGKATVYQLLGYAKERGNVETPLSNEVERGNSKPERGNSDPERGNSAPNHSSYTPVLNTQDQNPIHHSPEPLPDVTPSEPHREPENLPAPITPALPEAYARTLYSPDYEAFWVAYPRRVGKKAAYAAWQQAIREIDPGSIIAAAERYAHDPNREDQFTAHPTTWLRQGRWEDESLPAKSTRQATGGERRMDAYAAIAAKLGQRDLGEIGA